MAELAELMTRAKERNLNPGQIKKIETNYNDPNFTEAGVGSDPGDKKSQKTKEQEKSSYDSNSYYNNTGEEIKISEEGRKSLALFQSRGGTGAEPVMSEEDWQEKHGVLIDQIDEEGAKFYNDTKPWGLKEGVKDSKEYKEYKSRWNEAIKDNGAFYSDYKYKTKKFGSYRNSKIARELVKEKVVKEGSLEYIKSPDGKLPDRYLSKQSKSPNIHSYSLTHLKSGFGDDFELFVAPGGGEIKDSDNVRSSSYGKRVLYEDEKVNDIISKYANNQQDPGLTKVKRRFADYFGSKEMREVGKGLNIDEDTYQRMLVRGLTSQGGEGSKRLGVGGTYSPALHLVEFSDEDSGVHEVIHASGFDELLGLEAVRQLKESPEYTKETDYSRDDLDEYYEEPSEVYANLTNIIWELDLKPGQEITRDMVDKYGGEGFFNNPFNDDFGLSNLVKKYGAESVHKVLKYLTIKGDKIGEVSKKMMMLDKGVKIGDRMKERGFDDKDINKAIANYDRTLTA